MRTADASSIPPMRPIRSSFPFLSVLLCVILTLPAVAAHPFLADGYINSVTLEQTAVMPGDSLRGIVRIGMNEPSLLNGKIILDLVQTENMTAPRYAASQERLLVETMVGGIYATGASVTVPIAINVPATAPPGKYRLDLYAKSGRQYIGGFVNVMALPYSVPITVMPPIGSANLPSQEPARVIDLNATVAGTLCGTQGPFINGSMLPLTIVLLNRSQPLRGTVLRCLWDDTSEEDCVQLRFAAPRSPASVQVPMERPGAYGIKVSVENDDGSVSSVSRLRGVRNGTSPRITALKLSDVSLSCNRSIVATIIVNPSADDRIDPPFLLQTRLVPGPTVLASVPGIISERRIEFAPSQGIPRDRSETVNVTLPFPCGNETGAGNSAAVPDRGVPNAFTVVASIRSLDATTVFDEYTIPVDDCFFHDACC